MFASSEQLWLYDVCVVYLKSLMKMTENGNIDCNNRDDERIILLIILCVEYILFFNPT